MNLKAIFYFSNWFCRSGLTQRVSVCVRVCWGNLFNVILSLFEPLLS